MQNALTQDFKRYADLIRPAIASPAAFFPEAESAAALQVERGQVFASALIDRRNIPSPAILQPLTDFSRGENFASLTIVDRAAHRRAAYEGLLVYSLLQTYRLLYESLSNSAFGLWEETLRPWCDKLEADLTAVDLPDAATPASRGDAVAGAAWAALALQIAGKVYVRDAWTDLASLTFGRFTKAQASSGAFLTASPSDNPETHGYHELVILHAAASFAVQTEDRPLAAAVARATEFHRDQTQPDHATAQPWGVFAFVWNHKTRDVADQQLHAAGVAHPAGIDGISLMLLADALYCLQLFLPKEPKR